MEEEPQSSASPGEEQQHASITSDDDEVAVAAPGVTKGRAKKRGIFGRIFKRRKREESPPLLEDIFNETEAILDEAEVPVEDPKLTWGEYFYGKLPLTATEVTVERAADTMVEDLDLPPIVQAQLPTKGGRPSLVAASVPLALVAVMLLIRAAWYFYQHTLKVADEDTKPVEAIQNGTSKSLETLTNGTSTNGKRRKSVSKDSSSMHSNGNGHAVEVVKTLPVDYEKEKELQRNLEREAQANRALVSQNQALQEALAMHKSSVDKFSIELQSRNDRLTVFEKEQETVRRQLSSQIEVLKQELQQRQKQEQGNLKDKESLCNDLITKIKALNKDLENHEKLWHGVAQKAEKKEAESAAKVNTLKKSFQDEEQKRLEAVKEKEKAAAELSNKLRALEAHAAKRKAQHAAVEKQMGPGVFPAVQAKLEARLQEEEDFSSSLSTKLKVFGAELQSREERVSTLDAKMKEVERLSASELKELQRELENQVVQREKLQEAAVELNRQLQQKQNQCARLQSEWESSKKELKALDERVQTLSNDVEKREAAASKRVQSLQAQLDKERAQQEESQEKAETLNAELIKKQEEFVQLTTRMDLFLKELQFRDTQVTGLETKMAAMDDLATSEIKALQAQLQEAEERRNTWTKTTDDLTQLMKDKKAQVVGLTTRADLFELELQKRKESVEALEARIKARKETESVKMEPYRKELQRLVGERDSWAEKTDEIGRLLSQRIAQSEGLTTRLKLFRLELSKKDERLSLLKTTYEDKKQAAHLDMVPVRERLEQQCEERDAWTNKTEAIDRSLEEKRAQIVGMKTRVHLFGMELKKKVSVVAELEAIVAEKEEAGDDAVARLKKKVEALVQGRDDWKASTAKVIQLLGERKAEAAGLTSELKCLVSDLQGYQQRRAKLEAEAAQQRKLCSGRREALEEDLKAAQNHRDTWGEKTRDVEQALKATEQSIVGLETRAMLFQKELEQRGEVVSKLQKEYWTIKTKNSTKMEQLRGAIKAEHNLHEHGLETTVRLNKELKDTKRECVGLTTRSELFARELQKRIDSVSEQEKRISDAKAVAGDAIDRIRSALSEQEKGRDDWMSKTEEVRRLQVENDEAIVALGPALERCMAEVMKAEDSVAVIERKGYSQALSKELDAAVLKRDEVTAIALDIEKELKMRKSQVAGLTTRKMLFRVELEKRQKVVTDLKMKLATKERITAENIAPLEQVLQSLQQQKDTWTGNLERINKLLSEKQRQCLPISKRQGEVIDQLAECAERTEKLRQQLLDEETFYENKVKSLKSSLDRQRKELAAWKKSTADVNGLLKEKKQGTEGLKTRILVFRAELQKRQDVVDGVKSKMEELDAALAEELDLIDAQIEAEHLERDRIIETTLTKNQELKAMEDTCAAMAVRRKLFEDELHNREEQTTLFEAQLKEKEYDHSAEMKRLKSQLADKSSDCDKWRDSTQAIVTLLSDTEREIVGLATRSQLFNVEKEKYEQQVANLQDTLTQKETDSAEKIAPIHNQLQQGQQDRDSWDKKTVELDGMLQDNRREMVGLKTRSHLFKVELKKKEEGVATLSAIVKEKEEDFADSMKPLVQEYNTLKVDREKWEESTAKVKQLLERTQTEVSSIPTRLDLFRRELETRNNAVAELEASINSKEELVAIQFGFLLNELQLQQKQRGKWKKVTLEMHRVLKVTKETVDALTNNLEACNASIQQNQEKMLSLEAMLRDTRDVSEQQLYTLKSEVERQTEKRDKLRQSTDELNRLLVEAKELTNNLSERLATSEEQVQGCTSAIEGLEVKIAEKKALDASQIESIKAQLKIHLGQRAEWRENTNQMKKKLKEKQLLCTSLKTKLAMLKTMQSGEVRSSLSDQPDTSASGTSGVTAHMEKINSMTSNLGKKTAAEESLTTRMEVLEIELRQQREEEKELLNATQQMEQGLKENEAHCANLAGKVTSINKQYTSGAPFLDVDRMLADKEKKQSNLNNKLESLAGALMSL